MPSTSVSTYHLSTTRLTIGGVAYGPTSITLAPAASGTVDVVNLFYFPTDVVGYLVGSQLAAYFPREQLRTHLGILQSENPLFVEWELDPGDPTGIRLIRFVLATSEEFLGEGLTDTSPF
jgi:hypothetical protein